MTERHILCMGLGRFTEQIARLSLQKGIQVVVWDSDYERLESLEASLPIKTHYASWREIERLSAALREGPLLVAALADSDEANLVACQLIGQLGYYRCLAIFSDPVYLPFTQHFGVAYPIFPTSLLLSEIILAIFLPGTLPRAAFALGAIQMRTFRIPSDWKKASLSLTELSLPRGICIGCIRRLREGLNPAKESSYSMMIPHGEQQLLPGDEVVCFGQISAMRRLPVFFGVESPKIKKVVLSGVSRLAEELIRFLVVQDIPVSYIEEDKKACAKIAERYPECFVSAQSVEQWSAGRMDKTQHAQHTQHDTLFIACGNLFNTNLEQALFAKECGCEAIVTSAHSFREKNQVEQLGMLALSSIEEVAAERVMSILLSDSPIRHWLLYGGAVQIVELIVSRHSDAVGLPLATFFASILKGALILFVEHRGAVYSPTGETILFPGDRILLITTEGERERVLKLF